MSSFVLSLVLLAGRGLLPYMLYMAPKIQGWILNCAVPMPLGKGGEFLNPWPIFATFLVTFGPPLFLKEQERMWRRRLFYKPNLPWRGGGKRKLPFCQSVVNLRGVEKTPKDEKNGEKLSKMWRKWPKNDVNLNLSEISGNLKASPTPHVG